LKKVIVINGPNLNLLGKRQPEVYGSKSFEEFFEELKADYSSFDIEYYQSNVEGELVNKLHQVGFSYDGIVFNAGGYTHTSVAIADAVASIDTPTIEVHISNVYSREEYRHNSLMAANCKGVIAGFGLDSYRLALNSLV
jgi:3-dehydroquinate dehydratase-2